MVVECASGVHVYCVVCTYTYRTLTFKNIYNFPNGFSPVRVLRVYTRFANVVCMCVCACVSSSTIRVAFSGETLYNSRYHKSTLSAVGGS